ncbi:hopanoid biosynthesis associated radical SAM protein HpnH [Maridesulfovibrio ferrireducens]|uniref:Hopanoid biosynthesis associated radical SAM protein HpnH n=1 Tax=Maridesulfovibrio ferrireducens TaxID=246191 RepID=A0A1G9JRN6_9BACT|nr:adenosyl-hopene transferase HpnH [Maridesulfovibrio ferrireducens]SDL40207.1 hopanoid biosynthesis associated radical SAM protein HpnH [Maridesulfovibrio ferrireducens]
MAIPAIQIARLGKYILSQTLKGNKHYPLVLMLEPLFQCNLRCKGCGKINQPASVLNQRLSFDECIAAVEECGAPIVSIPGGEPLLHPEIPAIVKELVRRKKFVYLCTNGILIPERINQFKPSPYLTFNIHLDGLEEVHDNIVCKQGVFQSAIRSIKLLKSKGFRVNTNTTLFGGQTPENAAAFFDYLTGLGVDGMTLSAAFSYEAAADQDSFLTREQSKKLFREIFRLGKGKKWDFSHSSFYLDFLAGNQDYSCSPWGNPCRSVHGWQRPCYLLEDGFVPTYKELMEQTDWDKYGVGNDPRCANCMVHCGFEPTSVADSVKRPIKGAMLALKGLNLK